ncbi:Golgi-associated PDZ and coiled-coil motif-containing protein [Eumeta japonica]|uniref:Golgi-associated PDZ and coiled-coil motif-containing protein n=1 Tax=Eumeta variegata TaxID=151549 RepID=A0A4C1V2Q8_EUMVA|nr:Golgi-associated PDZ and coiled-coil motif-containing protein [Eumeta japonica]
MSIDRLTSTFEAPSKTTCVRFSEFSGGQSVLMDEFKEGRPKSGLPHNIDAVRILIIQYRKIKFKIVSGHKLATKYLDKELAGRIQQLQLLGRDMRADLRDSLWAQVEAEILLQRHKTLVRVCRGLAPYPPRPHHAPGAPPAPARPRTVRVRRSPHLGLGISITGGREHGVPILISELEAGGPAALTGELYVGDAILAINDVDLTQACHKEAVQALQSVKGDCALCVQFIATDDDDRLSEDNYRGASGTYQEQTEKIIALWSGHSCAPQSLPLCLGTGGTALFTALILSCLEFPLYPEDGEVFGGEPDGSGATPTAPRTPDYNRPDFEAGSRSECESPGYTEVPYRLPQAPYADYNSINNNLSILDMDDESIKIEAQVEPVKLPTPPASPVLFREGPRPRQRGAYRSLPVDMSSSNESPLSTPVHGRRPNLKKKRIKPCDWKSKGAYRAVDDDVHSSDEVQATVGSPHNGHGDSAVAVEASADADGTASPKTRDSVETSDLSPPEPQSVPETRELPPLVPLPPPQEVVLPTILKSKLVLSTKANGLENKIVKSKAFRIGSAKRVLESPAPITNGDSVTGEIIKYPQQQFLLSGDGDPDFGTPV